MATSFGDIFDLFLTRIQDYRIARIYAEAKAQASASAGDPNSEAAQAVNARLVPYLLFAVNKFAPYCDVDIVSSLNTEGHQFDITLPFAVKMVLAQLMVEYWMENVVQNILQMDGKLNDTDFRTYAEANNLRAKQDYLATVRENNSQLLVDYQLNHKIDWRRWAEGKYYSGI